MTAFLLYIEYNTSMTIYIDIIFIENLLMNYIILFGTGLVLKEKMKSYKLIISSVVGAIYAIIAYLNIIPIYSNIIMKILLSVIMCYIAFDLNNVKKMIKTLFLFYLVSFATGGLALALLYLISPSNIKFNNGVLVGTYPIQITIIAGFLGFCIIQYSFKVNKKMLQISDLICDLEINVCRKTIYTKAFIDSGNTLKDPITKKAVIIIEKEKVENALEREKIEYENIVEAENLEIPGEERIRYRFIPFKAIGKQNGMLLGIQAKFVRVIQKNNNEVILENITLGLYDKKINKNYSALIGLDLLQDSGNRKEGEISWE